MRVRNRDETENTIAIISVITQLASEGFASHCLVFVLGQPYGMHCVAFIYHSKNASVYFIPKVCSQ